MPEEPDEEKPEAEEPEEKVDRGLIGRLNAASDGKPRDAIAAASNEIAGRKAAGEPEIISPITADYFAGIKGLGIADHVASQLPDFAKAFRTGIESQNLGFKFVDAKFVDSMREALDKQLPSFKVNLAEEALKGFKFGLLADQIRESTTPTIKAIAIPSLFVDPTPTADLDIIRATIDEEADAPTDLEQVPVEVVTDIRSARRDMQEVVVEAANGALVKQMSIKEQRLWAGGAILVAVILGVAAILVAIALG